MKKIEFKGKKYIWLTWKDIFDDVTLLSRKITDSNKKFTELIGIQRWGYVIAALLSDYLEVKKVYSIGCSYYHGTKRKKFTIYQHLPKNFKGKSTLLIDDVADTGKTLLMTQRYIDSKNVATAVLHVKPTTRYIPDFYAKMYEGWICYPWSRIEFKRDFTRMYDEKTFEKIFGIK